MFNYFTYEKLLKQHLEEENKKGKESKDKKERKSNLS